MSNPDPSKLSKRALLEMVFENTNLLLGRPKGFSFKFGPVQEKNVTGEHMADIPTLVLTDNQNCPVSLESDDIQNNPSPFTGTQPVQWTTSDPTIAAFQSNGTDPLFLNGTIVTTGKLGNCQLSVIGLDAENNQVPGIFNLQVTPSKAVKFAPKFGAPVEKTPPAPASGAPTSK